MKEAKSMFPLELQEANCILPINLQPAQHMEWGHQLGPWCFFKKQEHSVQGDGGGLRISMWDWLLQVKNYSCPRKKMSNTDCVKSQTKQPKPFGSCIPWSRDKWGLYQNFDVSWTNLTLTGFSCWRSERSKAEVSSAKCRQA